MGQKELQFTIQAAIREAATRRHEYVTPEHLLYALTFEETCRRILFRCGGDIEALRRDLEQHFEQAMPIVQASDSNMPKQSIGFRRVLERAILHVRTSSKSEIDCGDVLVAMFVVPDSHAVFILGKHGIRRLDVVRYISHGESPRGELASQGTPGSQHLDPEAGPGGGPEGHASAGENPLERFAVDLTELAREGKLDPLIGRKPELQRIMQVLCRRTKNNPVLVGEAGVGKTAIVEGLAQLIVSDNVPERLQSACIMALDLGSLLAGTKFRGQFEERFKATIDAVLSTENPILFIDEMHMIVGAGSTTGSSMDASNLLKPVLQAGTMRCVGATTHEDFRKHLERDRALVRRLQKITISETTVSDTARILKGLRERYESFHEVKYSDEALNAAAELSARYINERYLPDKAIDVIDEAGAHNHMRHAGERLEILTELQVEETVAQIAGVPDLKAHEGEAERLRGLMERVGNVLFGQDHAIDSVVNAVKLSRAGLGQPTQPVGSFLLAGPTGVGKTELARQLAKELAIGFFRFDMSEYMEKHTVSRLIGAPPGYVGYDQGGLLTEAIRKTPHAVLLLDEIEKAHPDLFDILLQVMDHATLTDNNGRKADFRNVLLLMTTNAGARQMSRPGMGFAQERDTTRSLKELERLFSPEFRNRLTGIITFNHLSNAVMKLIVGKFIDELKELLAARNVDLHLTSAGINWLASRGHDEVYGARPLARLIQNEIRQPLADELLFGRLKNGGTVTVGVRGDSLDLRIRGSSG